MTIMLMRCLKGLAIAAMVLLMAACSENNLEKMVPADATGVVSIDVQEILKQAGMIDDGKIVLPASLQQAIDDNDTSPLCVLLSDLPQLGLETRDKAYLF